MIKLIFIVIVSIGLSFNTTHIEAEQNNLLNESGDSSIECGMAIMSSGGSCVSSLGDVCSYYSEWILNTKWEADDEDEEDDESGG